MQASCSWAVGFARIFRRSLSSYGFPVAVTGLVFEAESALMTYEREMRVTETALRKEARMDLARRGLIGTESEIAKWKAERQSALNASSLDNDSSRT
jgi:hypothetical protein